MIYAFIFSPILIIVFEFFIPWDGIVSAILGLAAAFIGGIVSSIVTSRVWTWLAVRRGWVREKS